MNLFIYSNLKAELESKGLDSITSGQIAWFVCSISLFCILFMYCNQFIFAFIALSVYVINLIYIRNTLALVAVVMYWCFAINYSNFNIFLIASAITLAICIVLRLYRAVVIFCLGFLYLYISLQVFNALGGLIK